jgi:hypothetical protein
MGSLPCIVGVWYAFLGVQLADIRRARGLQHLAQLSMDTDYQKERQRRKEDTRGIIYIYIYIYIYIIFTFVGCKKTHLVLRPSFYLWSSEATKWVGILTGTYLFIYYIYIMYMRPPGG